MSLKPIDYQAMLPRSNEISRISSAEQNKHHAANSHAMKTVSNKMEDEKSQVYKKDNAEHVTIKEHKERKQKNNDQKKKDKKNFQEKTDEIEDNNKNNENSRSKIDIRI